MWPSVEQIEAVGKLGGAIVGMLIIGGLFWASLQRNAEEADLIRRQVFALERIVDIYSGGQPPAPWRATP